MADEIGVIDRQMADTRKDLGKKAEALEEQVVSTVKDTASAVSETVDNVKETVQQTTQAVTDTVKSVTQALDISAQVRNHPWLMVGGGLALGYMLHLLLNKSSSRTEQTPQRRSQPAVRREQASRPQEKSKWSEALGAVWDSWGPLADKLKGLAIGATAGVLGEALLQFAPQTLKNGLSDLVNQMTQRMGGTIMRPQHPEQQHQEQHQPHQQEQHHQQQHHRETRNV